MSSVPCWRRHRKSVLNSRAKRELGSLLTSHQSPKLVASLEKDAASISSQFHATRNTSIDSGAFGRRRVGSFPVRSAIETSSESRYRSCLLPRRYVPTRDPGSDLMDRESPPRFARFRRHRRRRLRGRTDDRRLGRVAGTGSQTPRPRRGRRVRDTGFRPRESSGPSRERATNGLMGTSRSDGG
jgi:hypothetical protein